MRVNKLFVLVIFLIVGFVLFVNFSYEKSDVGSINLDVEYFDNDVNDVGDGNDVEGVVEDDGGISDAIGRDEINGGLNLLKNSSLSFTPQFFTNVLVVEKNQVQSGKILLQKDGGVAEVADGDGSGNNNGEIVNGENQFANEVNTILKCPRWDNLSEQCLENWIVVDIPFVQNADVVDLKTSDVGVFAATFVKVAEAEMCTDYYDNDGDFLTDCSDSDCSGQLGPMGETCEPSGETICNDWSDNDGDYSSDCSDSNCNGLTGPSGETCEYATEVSCSDGYDNDGDYTTDCSDSDCFGVSCSEVCSDYGDNDADGFADCSDSECDGQYGAYGQLCESSGELTCNDFADNDDDGFIDCSDSDCDGLTGFSGEICEPSGETICNDWYDNDVDYSTDCSDSSCNGLTGPSGEICEFAAELSCSDGYDNDGDSYTDCSDPDCYGASCSEVCTDYGDNDADGFIDCSDSDCDGLMGDFGQTCEPSGEVSCSDWYDNDVDSSTDCADLDCNGLTGPMGEICEPLGEVSCSDGYDNDGDYLTDDVDSDCSGASTETSCINYIDDDGDGFTDCSDSDCDTSLGPSGEICEYAIEISCSDGYDNDGDLNIDCSDTDCSSQSFCAGVMFCYLYDGDETSCNSADCTWDSFTNFCYPNENLMSCSGFCDACLSQNDCESSPVSCVWDGPGSFCYSDYDNWDYYGSAASNDGSGNMYGFVPPDCSTNPEQCDNRYDHVDSYYDIETNCFDGVDNDNNGDIDCSDVACCGIGSCSLDVCTADTTAPSFTSTNVDVFSDFLMMFWSTNEPTNASVLFYDTDSTCTNSPTVIDEFSESGDLFDNYLMWHNVALDNFEGVVTLSPSTTYYYKLISSNRADYYAQTSCLNVTTQVSNDEFNFMFDGGDGMDIEFDLGEGFESKDFSAGSQPFNNTKDAKVRFPDQGITFNGIDISKSKTINLSSMFKDGVDENGNAFAGIDSDKWLQMAQNLGLSSDENVTLTIEDNGDTIFKCDDNGNNCADVTSLVTVDSINSTHKNAIIPVYLGFSAYSSGSSADLTIWDQIELNASLFGAIGLIKFPGFNIPFYANFSNNSNGSLIGGANCNISFSDNWGSKFNMVEDSTNGVYNYTKIGGMIDPGTYNFNVTCGGVNGFDELTLLDSFIISNPQNVPEWDEWAIFMILIVAVSGFFVMKREE